VAGGQVATVGQLQLSPNLINVIPREASLSIDLRNSDDARLCVAEAELEKYLRQVEREEGVTITVDPLVRTKPVQFDERIVRLIETVSKECGQIARRMTSGAGHDAQMIAAVAPAAMIFVPSIGGISHNPKEDTAIRHLEIGANVLLQCLMRLSNQ
jgi:N-carbamoyl-L-amino-acid hydrolase